MVAYAASGLLESISNDTRTGTLPGTVTRSLDPEEEARINLMTSLPDTEGNASTLATTATSCVDLSGSTFTGGTNGPVTEKVLVKQFTVTNAVRGIPVRKTSFLTGLANTRQEIQVIPTSNRNVVAQYDVFWYATGTGSVKVDLIVVTVRVPSTQPMATFPEVPTQNDPTALEAVLRADTGIENTYDCFSLVKQ